MLSSSLLTVAGLLPALVSAAPALTLIKKNNDKSFDYSKAYDVQGHRGARGQAVESTIAAFAWGLISGVTTLELDNGISKDGHVIVWHDEPIDPLKCQDTKPAFANDPLYPYVGKYVANLTLAQLKTLDCGSLRLEAFPQQLVYPGHKLATLPELFDFVKCTGSEVLFNIESKVNPIQRNRTQAPEIFVEKQLEVFQTYDLVDRITYQSFDWRTIKQAKTILPNLKTAALADDTTLYARIGEEDATSGPSDWLAGINIANFQGATPAARLAQAAASIKADILSPGAQVVNSDQEALDPTFDGYESFVNASMVETAHSLGLEVKPYTINRVNTAEQLADLGTDGIITDYPKAVRDWAKQRGYSVAPTLDYELVNKCFKQYAQFTDSKTPDLL